ncbi:SRPBCC family protein [Bacillus sp. JJ722]|uniref:SRPBCC family protein n=1 Tax=Bacillus sp. JJ722 TaxID=3122973 RepID=UPI002FFF1CC1
MLAVIEKVDNGYIARYDLPLKHSVNKVWSALTQNDQLKHWMSNLQVEVLGIKGNIRFNYNDGSGNFLNMKITDFKESSLLEFEWGEGRVRFEVIPMSADSLLVLKEYLPTLNDHTPKDLAGWHVCLHMLSALLDGNIMEFPKDEWEQWYEKYMNSLNQIKNDF